jgi:hypothetical protein
VGEIVGYAENLLGRAIYYAVEFDGDELTYVFLEREVEPTGGKGNRRIITESYLHTENLMFRIRDTYETDHFKPRYFREGKTFVLSFSEEYALEHVVPFIREIVIPCPEFKECKNLIVDYTHHKHLGYLGIGDEITILLNEFKKNNGTEYVFAIKDDDLADLLEMLINEKYPKIFATVNDALDYFKHN